MTEKFYTLFVLALFPLCLFSQQSLRGSICDEKGEPLVGSSIFIRNTYTGTVSNRNGNFHLQIPASCQDAVLLVSSIGYQTRKFKLRECKSPLNISLQKDTCRLSEVLIMPEDKLLALLRRAEGKIKENYPDQDSRLKGCYRETYYIPENNEYLYFGEARMQVFKTSYGNRSEGQIEIEDSRMNKHPLYDSLSRIVWYGGHFSPIYQDYVKRRSTGISPSNYHSYDYRIGKAKYEGREVYQIHFAPKDLSKGSFRGFFYLDCESLAYLYFEKRYTDYGIRQRTKDLNSRELVCQSIKNVSKYRKVNGRYYLAYLSDHEVLYNERLDKQMVNVNEYFTTDFQTAEVKPIPFLQQSNYKDVFYVEAKDYKESNWEQEDVVLPDSALLHLLYYDSPTSKDLLNQRHHLPRKYERKQKLVKIMSKLTVNVEVLRHTMELNKPVQFAFQTGEQQPFSASRKAGDHQMYSLAMRMGYRLRPDLDVGYYISENMGDDLLINKALSVNYSLPLINRGRQLFLDIGLRYNWTNYALHLGDFHSSENFKLAGQKIDADQIAIFVGQKTHGPSLDFKLKTRISRFFRFYAGMSASHSFAESDRMFVQEKSGFFLFRKKVDTSLSNPLIDYREGQVNSGVNALGLNRFAVCCGVEFSF